MAQRSGIIFAGLLVGLMIVLAAMTGCAVHTAALDDARVSYAQASSNPTVAQNAPTTLSTAEQNLRMAEESKSSAEQEHYAALSQRQSQEAIQEANRIAAEKRAAQASAQAQVQSQQAEMARERAEAARQEAATATGQAEMSSQEAARKEEEARIAREQAAGQVPMGAAGQAPMAAGPSMLTMDQSQQLRTQFSDMGARETERGVSMTLPDTMFEPHTAVLTPTGVADVNRLADNLAANPNERAVIEGHSDSAGSPMAGQQFSEDRANAVRDALIARGVSPDRIVAQGLGGRFPVTSNETEAGREQNRRVDIVVTG